MQVSNEWIVMWPTLGASQSTKSRKHHSEAAGHVYWEQTQQSAWLRPGEATRPFREGFEFVGIIVSESLQVRVIFLNSLLMILTQSVWVLPTGLEFHRELVISRLHWGLGLALLTIAYCGQAHPRLSHYGNKISASFLTFYWRFSITEQVNSLSPYPNGKVWCYM